jgi:hypothetical protein
MSDAPNLGHAVELRRAAKPYERHPQGFLGKRIRGAVESAISQQQVQKDLGHWDSLDT